MIHVGDIVQTYAYGRPYRTGEVLQVSMGRAQVKITKSDITWIDCDFLTKIN